MHANGEMADILRAIREVDASLERRAARGYGAAMIIWGAVVGCIFLFYQLVAWNPAPYRAWFGPFLPWAWTVPTLLGYALTTLLGTRLGRLLPRRRRTAWWIWTFASLAPVGVLVVLLLTGETDRIAGLWIAFLGVMCILGGAPRSSAARVPTLAFAAASVATGAALLVFPAAWGLLAAAAFYGLGLTALGTTVYLAG